MIPLRLLEDILVLLLDFITELHVAELEKCMQGAVDTDAAPLGRLGQHRKYDKTYNRR